MMITKNKFLCAMSLLAFATSCTNEDLDVLGNSLKSGETFEGKMIFHAPSFEEDGTSQTRTNMDMTQRYTSWSSGDKISIRPNEHYATQIAFTVSTQNGTGSFSTGNVLYDVTSDWGMKNGVSYVAYYPFSSEENGGDVPVDFTSKGFVTNKQSGNIDISKFDLMYSQAQTCNGDMRFYFTRKYVLNRVNFSNLPEKTWKKIYVSTVSGSSTLKVKGKLMLWDGSVSVSKSSASYVIYSGDGWAGKKYMSAYFPLLPSTDTGALNCYLEATDGSVYVASLASKSLKAGTYNQWDVSSVSVTDHGATNGHAWIDLGLPSGTKWATMNLGATSVASYGRVYAWGETKGYNQYDSSNKLNYKFANSYYKTTYDNWATYKYGNGAPSRTGYSFEGNDDLIVTKYCTYHKYGLPDNLTVLNTDDDAAYTTWGSEWRMPTDGQWRELFENCYYEYFDDYQGMHGFVVYKTANSSDMGVNGQADKREGYSLSMTHIFIPDPNYFDYDSNHPVSSIGGFYWTSTLDLDNNRCAKAAHIRNRFFYIEWRNHRSNGYPIRPVRI